jgi:hypothetical protein
MQLSQPGMYDVFNNYYNYSEYHRTKGRGIFHLMGLGDQRVKLKLEVSHVALGIASE